MVSMTGFSKNFRKTLKNLYLKNSKNAYLKGSSIITSRPGGRWVYAFFVILRDGKLGCGWYLIKVRDSMVKKVSIKQFCII